MLSIASFGDVQRTETSATYESQLLDYCPDYFN